MSSRRPLLLMGILLASMLGYAYRTYWYPYHGGGHVRQESEPAPLAGSNAISGLLARPTEGSNWRVGFDYFYTGAPRDVRADRQLLAVAGAGGGSVGGINGNL